MQHIAPSALLPQIKSDKSSVTLVPVSVPVVVYNGDQLSVPSEETGSQQYVLSLPQKQAYPSKFYYEAINKKYGSLAERLHPFTPNSEMRANMYWSETASYPSLSLPNVVPFPLPSMTLPSTAITGNMMQPLQSYHDMPTNLQPYDGLNVQEYARSQPILPSIKNMLHPPPPPPPDIIAETLKIKRRRMNPVIKSYDKTRTLIIRGYNDQNPVPPDGASSAVALNINSKAAPAINSGPQKRSRQEMSRESAPRGHNGSMVVAEPPVNSTVNPPPVPSVTAASIPLSAPSNAPPITAPITITSAIPITPAVPISAIAATAPPIITIAPPPNTSNVGASNDDDTRQTKKKKTVDPVIITKTIEKILQNRQSYTAPDGTPLVIQMTKPCKTADCKKTALFPYCHCEDHLTKKNMSKMCIYPDCTHRAWAGGFCRGHGGGERCAKEGCKNSASGTSIYCKKHGGGDRCSVPGCNKSAQRFKLCNAHGGRRPCQYPRCKSQSKSNGLCLRHGGGRRCKFEGCGKLIRKRQTYCEEHEALSNTTTSSDNIPATIIIPPLPTSNPISTIPSNLVVTPVTHQ